MSTHVRLWSRPNVQRLKTRPQFQAVLAGTMLAKTTHFALHGLVLDAVNRVGADATDPLLFVQRTAWLGAMVPKRWAKRAVTRNAIKRQIYAVAAQVQVPVPARAHVVRLRAGFDRGHFVSASSDVLKAAVRAELQQLFMRAQMPPQGLSVLAPAVVLP